MYCTVNRSNIIFIYSEERPFQKKPGE